MRPGEFHSVVQITDTEIDSFDFAASKAFIQVLMHETTGDVDESFDPVPGLTNESVNRIVHPIPSSSKGGSSYSFKSIQHRDLLLRPIGFSLKKKRESGRSKMNVPLHLLSPLP
jgi:hypothetical protein